jgi:hypothetical protein
MQTFRAALYHAGNKHEAFVKPNLNFGITKEEVTKREVSEARECAHRSPAGGFSRHLNEVHIKPISWMAGVRKAALANSEKRMPKWKLRLAPDLIVQLQPKPVF